MQILPLVNGKERAGLEALASRNADDYGRHAALFSGYLDDHLKSMEDAGLSGDSSLLATEEFSSSTSGSTTSSSKKTTTSETTAADGLALAITAPDLDNLKMTQEDFSELSVSLKQHGFTQQEIDDLAQKVASPDGLTWGRMIETIDEKIKGADKVKTFTSDEKLQLDSFFQKLGFTPGQSDKLISSLERGEYKNAWNKISARMNSISADDGLSFSAEEATALAKALNLSDDAQNRLTGLFSKLGSTELSSKGMRDALLMIKSEIKDQLSDENKSLQELKDIAAGILVKAQKKAYGQEMADARQDDATRKVMQAESLGDDKAKNPTDSIGKSAAQQTAEADDSVRPELKQSVKDQSDQDAKNALAERKAAGQNQESKTGETSSKDAQTVADARRGQNEQGGKTGEQGQNASSGRQNGENQKLAQDNLMGEIMSKAGVEKGGALGHDFGSELGSQTGVFGAEGQTGVQSGSQTASLTLPKGAARQASYSNIMEQVQNGILKNLGQGVKQLTVRLTPEHLGRLSVVLSVKNSEVNATIRADNQEAAQIIGDRLGQIKEHLEQQGLKVSKLEVQTSLPQDVGTSFGGAQQHNEARERREFLSRARNVMRLMQEDGTAATLAEEGAVAQYASAKSGLDIIA